MKDPYYYRVMYFLIFIVIGSSFCDCFGQKSLICIEDRKPNYLLIIDMHISDPLYFEDESDARAGTIYRTVTTKSEIYNTVFLERMVIDIEESPIELDFSKALVLDNLYQTYGLSKETNPVTVVGWISENCFELKIADKKFRVSVAGNFDSPKLKAHLVNNDNGH